MAHRLAGKGLSKDIKEQFQQDPKEMLEKPLKSRFPTSL
jgi:hypothetical protein